MRRILIVDDDWAMLELMKLVIPSNQFDVVLASTKEEFFAAVQKGKPDLILLDIVLGEDDGVEVYETMLRDGLLPEKTPVIFISGLAKGLTPKPPQPGRTYALIPKPFNTDELLRSIQYLSAD